MLQYNKIGGQLRGLERSDEAHALAPEPENEVVDSDLARQWVHGKIDGVKAAHPCRYRDDTNSDQSGKQYQCSELLSDGETHCEPTRGVG